MSSREDEISKLFDNKYKISGSTSGGPSARQRQVAEMFDRLGAKKQTTSTAKTSEEKKHQPGDIKALGASDYGASSDTRLDNIIRSAGYLSASGQAKMLSLLSGGTGELTIGQNAQAAIKGQDIEELQRQKKERQDRALKSELSNTAKRLRDTARIYQEKATAPLDENSAFMKFNRSMADGELTMGENIRAYRNGQTVKQAQEAKKQRQRANITGESMGRLIGEIGINAAQMGLDATTGPAALGTMFVRAAGSRALELEEEGKSEHEQLIGGLTSGLIEVLTEKVGGPFQKIYGKTALGSITNKFIKSLGKSKAGKAALKLMTDFASEGAEEVLANALNPIADKLTGVSSADWDWEEMYGDDWAEKWAHDFLVGGILGLAGGGIEIGIDTLQSNARLAQVGKRAANTDALIETALRLGGKAAEYTKTELSDRQVGKIYEQVQVQQLEKNVEGRLKELGASNTAKTAEAIVAELVGDGAKGNLIKTKEAQRALTELADAINGVDESTNTWAFNALEEMAHTSELIFTAENEKAATFAEETADTIPTPTEEGSLPLIDQVAQEQAAVESGESLPPMNLDEQKQFIRDRYSKQVEKGLLSEDSIDSMITELDDGISLDSVIRRADNYIKETENNERNNAADGSMGRESGTGAGEQGGAVSEGAGRSEGSERAADGRAKEIRRDPQKKNTRRVSSKSLGLSNGTDTARLSVVEHGELGETANNIAILLGAKNVTVVKGAIEVSDENGKIRNVCGVKTADGKIIVRADHPLYSLEQLMLHETSHAYENTDMLEEMRAAAIEAIGEEALNELCIQYAVKWGGLYTEEDMHGVAAKKECEVYADALAGISRANTRGTKKLTSAIRKVFYKNTGIDVDLLMSYNTPKAAEAKQGKAQTAAAEPKAQAPPKEQNDPHNLNYSLDDYSDSQIKNWENSKRIVVYDSSKGDIMVEEFARKAMNDTTFVSKLYFGTVGEKLAERIKKDTGYNFYGRNVTLRADNIRKIAKSHGVKKHEESRGQRKVEEKDYALIPHVIGEPDSIKGFTYKNRAAAVFAKKIAGSKVSVFMVDSGGSLDLFVQTMYAGAKKESVANMTNAEALTITPETTAGTALAERIPSSAQNVNNDYSVDELDSEYYEAIHNGDTQRVQALVDEAAIRAMPNSRIVDEDGKLLKVYHGSDAQFDVFDRSKARSKMDINGSFFSPWELDAQGYGSNVRAFYLNIANPAPEQVGFRALNRFKSQNQAGIKAREYLERMGYDGVNNSDEEFIAFSPEQIKSADPITYDENGKVIPLSERFNLQNEDIRYSVDDAIATEEEAQYRRDYQKVLTGESLKKLRERRIRLEGTIDGYRKNDKLTEGQTKEVERLEANLDAVNAEIEKKTKKAEARRTTNKNAAEAAEAATDSLSVRLTTAQSRRALKGQLYEQYGISTGRRDVGAAIDAFADKWISQGRISSRDIASFEDALMQLGAIRVESENDYAREIRSWMANGQISVPQYVVEEFGNDWNSFRKRAFGNSIYLSIDSNHRGIDQWTQELANSFGEGVFDESADLKTQLEKIVDIAEDGRAENLTVYQMAEHIRKTQGRDSADEYLEDMHNQLIRNLKSFSQSAKIEMDIVKRNTYRRVRDDYIRREKAERAANERAQREFQKKVLKQLQWLKRNQNFMGSDFQKEARRILADIDTIAISAANEMNWSEKYQATWKDLGRMYKWAQEHDPNFLPNKEIENMISRVEGTHLDELSAYDLENIYKAAVALRTAFYNRNNVIGDELHRSFAEMYDDARAELKAADKPKDTTSRTQKYWDSQLNPIHRIERMFGWNENSAGFQIFGRGLERGERATKRYVEQSNQLLDVWLEEHKDWVSKSDGQGKDAVWYELEVPELLQFKMGDKPIFGKSVKVYMTPMQKIYMYLESKNYDNLRHMVGGRTFADKSLYAEGKREEAFANGTTISLAPETVKKIVSDLTAEELELAEILDKQYFNGYAKTEINRVSNILYGYDRAMNENYAPIFTNSNYNKTEPGMLQDGTAEGVGHMKTRAQGAKNPTYNVSALEAFRKHVSQTSRFVGMAIPVQNAKTLLNWSGNGTTMQEAITHSWSKKELDDLKSIMTELQAPTYLEQSEFATAIGKLMSNYIGGVFGSNITVAAKVLASKPTAAIVLGNRYYPTIAQQKTTDAKLISKYTSELDVRARGYGTPELAAMTLSQSKYMQWVQSHKGTKLFLGGGLLQAADIYVTKMMWPWAENKVRAEYPELEIGTQEEIDSGNSPFYKKVAEIYENAIGDTQSMYDIMHRSDIMRDTNEITRSFTIFHTDSLQAMNLIRKRAGELSAAKKNAEKAQTDETKAAANAKVKTAAKELSSCIGNVILMNAVVTLFDILRDLFRRREDKYANDEGEITFWSFIGNSLTQLMDNASGMLIGVDALTSAILTIITGDTYYDHEIIAVKTFNDLIKLGQDTEKGLRGFITNLVDVIQNDGDVWEYIVNDGDARGTIKTAAEKIAHFFGGLPIENVEKLLVNTIGLFFPQVSAAYSGFWQTSSKKELSDSKSLETDIANLYSNKLDLSDEIAEELARLYEAGYKNAVITDTPETVTIEGEEIELNEALRQKYNDAAGKALEYLEEVIGSDEYQAASDEDKAKMLNRLNGYAGDVAKAAVTGAKLEGFAANVPGWLDEGMSWGQIVSGNTNENKIAAKYYEAGVEPRVVNEVIETLEAIEPEDGKKPTTSQKVRAIGYMTLSESNKEAALSVALSEKAYTRYMIARNNGVSSADYADFLEILDHIDVNGGDPSRDDFKTAVERANFNRNAAREIWATYWKSSSPW